TAAQSPTVDVAPGGMELAAAPSAAEPSPPAPDSQPARTPATGATTVLLVEPSRAQAVIIRKYLQEIGFHDISTTTSGREALEIARKVPPAVVISAMHLADMTGMQLAQKMRAEESVSPPGFVLITSQADAAEANLKSQEGTLVRLPKPFDLAQLAQAL